MQKVWVRRDHQGIFRWEIGCQCCGCVIAHAFTWGYALDWALEHAEGHR